jgi:hypothetical protein
VEAAAVEEDRDTGVDLQDLRVSHLATHSLLPVAVLVRRIEGSKPADFETGMWAIRESRRDVNLKPPLPDETAGHP